MSNSVSEVRAEMELGSDFRRLGSRKCSELEATLREASCILLAASSGSAPLASSVRTSRSPRSVSLLPLKFSSRKGWPCAAHITAVRTSACTSPSYSDRPEASMMPQPLPKYSQASLQGSCPESSQSRKYRNSGLVVRDSQLGMRCGSWNSAGQRSSGRVSAKEVSAKEASRNTPCGWKLRLGGPMLMTLAVVMSRMDFTGERGSSESSSSYSSAPSAPSAVLPSSSGLSFRHLLGTSRRDLLLSLSAGAGGSTGNGTKPFPACPACQQRKRCVIRSWKRPKSLKTSPEG
mmetsp:Transcript_135852/g.321991  ORF Transcript_135852/g.321991 Transcript_135852/m.321991 type:complete len:290 (+) Transcript_135852:1931-2800(+)